MSKESKANNSGVKEEKNKQAMNRRKLLGSLAVVGGVSAMPSNWVKPVINSVILPAHAQTSTISDGAPASGAPASPQVQALILEDDTIDLTSVALGGLPSTFALNAVAATSAASGGSFEISVSLPPAGPVAIVDVTFAFQDSGQQPGGSSSATIAGVIGSIETLGPFVDSLGIQFSIAIGIAPDGNALNLLLIL